jgi:hypothetical protein
MAQRLQNPPAMRPLGSHKNVRASARHAGERGSTLVEFALAAPILFMVTFLIADIGMYFFKEHSVQFATREGVRLALVGGTLRDSQGNPMSREASIISTIQRYAAVAGIKASDLQISIYPVDSNYNDPPGWEAMRDSGRPGQFMRVKTRYDYSFITPLVRNLGPVHDTVIQAQATYRNELFD